MVLERKKFLEQLKQNDLAEGVPSISESTAKFLHFLVKMKSVKNILEIGTAHGYSTIWLADAVDELWHPKFFTQKPVRTIEFSKPSFERAKLNVYLAKCENLVELYRGDAKEFLQKWNHEDIPPKFDLIFIDAQKRETQVFFELSSSLLAEDGVMVVDDVLKFKEKMSDFWEKITQNPNWEFVVLPLDADDGIMVLRKRDEKAV